VNRILRHRSLSTLSAIIALTAAAFLSFGGAVNAASPTTICFPSEGPFQCNLAISAPESVAAGQPFTVQVALGVVTEVGDTEVFTPLPPKDPCASNVVVTLKVSVGEGPFVTYTANASKGVATFNIGGLAASEFVELDATAAQAGGACTYEEAFDSLTVIPLAAGQPIAPCPPDVSCTQTTSGSGSAATLFANTGSFDAAFIPRVDNCGGGGPLDPNGVLAFTYFGTDPKTIIIALSPNLVTKGIGRYNICWKPTTGSAFYLQSCNKSGPPCVDFAHSGQGNSAFFGIQAPPGGSNGDPQVYPE
jgi:hypothetical protein